MNSKLTKNPKILVVVHDAGGAEVIGAYIRAHRKESHFIAYGAGPAVRVFKRLKIPLCAIEDSIASIAKAVGRHHDVAYALMAAPGWMTKIELRALEEAKKAGLKTVVYMESWEDERKRFGFPRVGWHKRLPDMFWAGDKYARSSLIKQLPHVPVRLVPNQYFRDEVARYKALKGSNKPDAILFTSTTGGDSHELLENILFAASRNNTVRRVRIRYHPGDNRNSYEALIRKFKDSVCIEESRENDLAKDLLKARTVIGTETVAMVVGVLCGIRTISLVKKDRKPMLPFPRIKRIHSAEEVERLI